MVRLHADEFVCESGANASVARPISGCDKPHGNCKIGHNFNEVAVLVCFDGVAVRGIRPMPKL